ncbi:hypothetical protein [Streptomyces sp. NPDC059575]|uniref:hypothetical protein n=1 Tax=Streptomyces sp. NPDC059575 TaxID=3346872 RepID=UPI0036B7A961
MKHQSPAVPAYTQPWYTAYTAKLVVEPWKEFAEYRISHLRIKGQMQSLVA